jgi:hypothetical protein
MALLIVSLRPLLALVVLPGVKGDSSSSSKLDGVRGRSGKRGIKGAAWGGVMEEDSLPLSSSSSSELEE